MARISPLVALPVIVFAGLAGLFLSGMMRDDPDALPSAREGRPAPGFELAALGDKPALTRGMLDGEGIKIVNYWASWCAPCRVEHPTIAALSEEFPVYGINFKDDPEKALAFLAELGDPYDAIATDPNGRAALDWGVYGVPETYVIDGEGRIVLRFAGPVTQRVLSERIRPAIEAAGG